MTHERDLTRAVEYCDRLAKIRGFRRVVKDWRGDIKISIGNYEARVSARCVSAEFGALLDAEERMLLNTLEIWGVTGTGEIGP